MTATAARANQVAVRAANERLGSSLAAAAIASDRVVPYICECSDPDCLGRVEMSSAAYDAAHVDRGHFVVLRCHALAEGEEVVEQREGYDIVEKRA